MPTRLIAALTAGVLLAAAVTVASPSRAEINYPWCVQFGGGSRGIGATSCGFVSREQCMGTARGLGDICVENPAYPGPSSPPMKPRQPSREPR